MTAFKHHAIYYFFQIWFQPCETCDLEFSEKYKYDVHLRTIHNVAESETYKENTFVSWLCGFHSTRYKLKKTKKFENIT